MDLKKILGFLTDVMKYVEKLPFVFAHSIRLPHPQP